MSIRTHHPILIAAGAALTTAASGQPASRATALTDRAARDPGETIAATPPSARLPAGNAIDQRLDLSGAFGPVARSSARPGADGANFGTMDADFENLPLLPAPLAGPYAVTWGGAWSTVTGGIRFAAPTAPLTIPRYGAVNDPVGGNSTVKLRGFVAPPAYGPNAFFGRWCRMDIFKGFAPDARFIAGADTGHNLRIAHDTYVNSIESLWTSEPTYVSSGFILGRILWGGGNTTAAIGLPIGPVRDFYTLGPNPAAFLTGIFHPLLFPPGHPHSGEHVPVPVNSWFTLIEEFDTTGQQIIKIDFHDGQGEIELYHNLGIQVGRMDRMAFACGMEVDNNACYIDNVHMEGTQFVLPTPPPLVCTNGHYPDDINWLHAGPLTQQSTRWVDALSSHAYVNEDAAHPGEKSICRVNYFADDRYRQEMRTLLPVTFAFPGNPYRICVDINLPSPPFGTYSTVQAIAPASITDNNFVTRMFIGRYDPMTNPHFTNHIYIQTDPEYNPIDDEDSPDPYHPGPNGNGGLIIPGFNAFDTGVAWVYDQWQRVCFEVHDSREMFVSINGVNIYHGESFVSSIDQLHFESENNAEGAGNMFCADNVDLACAVLPSVTLPPLALVYTDDLEWGIVGVTIGAQDDDNNPLTPFRWGSVSSMPVLQESTNRLLCMENLFRDTPAALPSASGFSSFVQADTRLPHVTASSTRGWVAACDSRLSDTETSRTWSVAQSTIAATQFARCTAVTFSSVTDTFWIQVPQSQDPTQTTWFDTRTTLAGAGAALNQFFSLSTHRNLNGEFTYRINGRLLRFTGGPNHGQVVKGVSLQSVANGVHQNMDAIFFLGSDEESAPAGSTVCVDNIRAWSLPCLGDTNNDGVVNFADLNNVLAFFGQSAAPNSDITGNIAPDADHDGVPDDTIVNFTDLNTVLSGFGIPCDATN